MEKLFGQRPWMVPLSTASSSGLSNNNESDSSFSSDISSFSSISQGIESICQLQIFVKLYVMDVNLYCFCFTEKKKSRAEQLADAIYGKLKRDREERHLQKLEAKKELHRLSEEKKEMRHKEKMTMRMEFIHFLNARMLKTDDTEAPETKISNTD